MWDGQDSMVRARSELRKAQSTLVDAAGR